MSLTFMGFHKPFDGYGYATIQIGRELKRIDPGIAIVNMDGLSNDPDVRGDETAGRLGGQD